MWLRVARPPSRKMACFGLPSNFHSSFAFPRPSPAGSKLKIHKLSVPLEQAGQAQWKPEM